MRFIALFIVGFALGSLPGRMAELFTPAYFVLLAVVIWAAFVLALMLTENGTAKT